MQTMVDRYRWASRSTSTYAPGVQAALRVPILPRGNLTGDNEQKRRRPSTEIFPLPIYRCVSSSLRRPPFLSVNSPRRLASLRVFARSVQTPVYIVGKSESRKERMPRHRQSLLLIPPSSPLEA